MYKNLLISDKIFDVLKLEAKEVLLHYTDEI